jgi:hypothetical protein
MKLKLLTPLLLIVSTLFFVANASAENPSGYTQKLNSEDAASLNWDDLEVFQPPSQPAAKEKTAKEIEEGRKTYWRRHCALQASHAKTEYIAKQLEKVCLEEAGATRSLFDW